MTEQLIADISEQLADHREKLSELLDELDSILKDGDDISARIEKEIARHAAGIIASTGALRALVEVANDEADEDDDEESPTGEPDED
jgi:uncharacterized protein involved in exopolysaccharide biosynthesis